MLELVIFTIILALIFDFLNGVNDAANAIATVVSTRVLTPRNAIFLAAFFNFFAFVCFGVAVATTIGTGIVVPSAVNEFTIMSALIGAIIWTAFATHHGLPISVSHALIGGLVGSSLVANGFGILILSGLLKIVAFMILAPILGLIASFFFMVFIIRIFRKSHPGKVNKYFKKLQLVSASLYSLSHGTNDAQKTMGIIALLLFSSGYLGSEFYVPVWVVLLCHAMIALGTLMGGWKVIRTMGMRITKLRPVDGFSAETSGAGVILGSTAIGMPVSTTHIICGSIMGVGATKRLSAVRWIVARNMFWAWMLTIPISAIISGVFYSILNFIL